MLDLTFRIFGPFTNKIIEIIENIDVPKRARRVDTREALRGILYVYETGAQWRNLSVKPHYTTFHKRFVKWSKLDVFPALWKYVLHVYSKTKIKEDKTWFKHLIIDSTNIKNVSGIDCIGYHNKEPNKKATKVSLICDRDKVPLVAKTFPANVHDVKTIAPTLDLLKDFELLNDKRNKHILLGDKGYITKEQFPNTRVLTYLRTNMKKQIDFYDQKLLDENRYKIEHCINLFKCPKRLRIRVDKSIDQYNSFTYISIISRISTKL